jgi:RNA polymerase sigma-70 factor (ECF subfamily)
MPRTLPPELGNWIEIVVTDNVDDLLRYFRRRVDAPEDAADLLGRVLLSLWETGARIPTTDEEARMWCFGIARNALRNHYRQTARRLSLADTLRDELRTSSLHADAADTTAHARIRNQRIRRSVASLDEGSRELVTLVHWDKFTLAQAARLLKINESTARTRYGRALQRLRRELKEPSLDEESDAPSPTRTRQSVPTVTTA